MGSAWVSVMAAILGSWGGAFISLRATRRTERQRASIQRDAERFARWHEKRLQSLEVIYQAFREYLDFLRRELYWPSNESLDPLHKFHRTIERELMFHDDKMARKIRQYDAVLMVFRSTSVLALCRDGEQAREGIRCRLDSDIPQHLERLRKNINEFADPTYRPEDGPVLPMITLTKEEQELMSLCPG